MSKPLRLRGLKSLHFLSFGKLPLSKPLRLRGLKLNAGYEGDVGTIVEAFAASWIEILPALQPSC